MGIQVGRNVLSCLLLISAVAVLNSGCSPFHTQSYTGASEEGAPVEPTDPVNDPAGEAPVAPKDPMTPVEPKDPPQGEDPVVHRPPVGTETETNLPRLVWAYWLNVVKGGLLHNDPGSPGGFWATYRPEGFVQGYNAEVPKSNNDYIVTDPGKYQGWDVLEPRVQGTIANYTREDFLHFELRREAKVAIVWFSNKNPTWLSKFQRDGMVSVNGTNYPVYLANFPAGEHYLGAQADAFSHYYLVLFAEKDGVPTPTPVAPKGFAQPQYREYCPAWVHDAYRTADGQRIYHPQIDPVYWCYFGHEHGSDAVGLFGSKHTHTFGPQPHGGHKIFAQESNFAYKINGVPQRGANTSFMVQLGFSDDRVCRKERAFQYIATDEVTGELLVRLDGMVSLPHLTIGDTNMAATPDCSKFKEFEPVLPRLQDVTDDIYGKNRVKAAPPLGSAGGYQTISTQNGPFAFTSSVNIAEVLPANGCATHNCPSPLTLMFDPTDGTPNKGTTRWFNMTRTKVPEDFTFFRAGPVKAIQGVHPDPDGDGHFCTNRIFTAVMDCADPGAYKQYIKPGVEVRIWSRSSNGSEKYWVAEPWYRQYNDSLGHGIDGIASPNSDLDGKIIGTQN